MPQMLTYQLENGTAQGYLAEPTGAGPFGAVIVIQEWWGVDQHIQGLVDRFATAGFLALAPDLYHGAVTSEPDEARKLVMALDIPRAVQELVGAANYLCSREDVRNIGTIGFCLGGSLALALGAATPRVGPVASFYGGHQLPDEELRRIGGPVLAVYGGLDEGIPAEARQHLDDVLTAQGIPHEIVVYADAGHAFMNDTRPQAYQQDAASDAWERMIAFFRHHLEQA